MTKESVSISDTERLLQRGISKVPIPSQLQKESSRWAQELTQVTPMIMAAQGDDEYAFYRNIMEEPELGFPLETGILVEKVHSALVLYFGVSKEELRLDDAFVVHYNMDQGDTSGAKHMDPSDITINMCIEKSDDVEGSEVMFYGIKTLDGVECDETAEDQFRVPQEEGFATIHFGSHPHETLPLLKGGKRTNIILTYRYLDKSRSDVDKRNCYFV